jgi:ABC-2 type transport system ATP-binding protein
MSDIPYRVTVAAEPARPLARELMGEESVDGVTINGTTLSIETNDLFALGTAVPTLAHRLGVRVTGFSPDDESLESVFRYLVVGR